MEASDRRKVLELLLFLADRPLRAPDLAAVMDEDSPGEEDRPGFPVASAGFLLAHPPPFAAACHARHAVDSAPNRRVGGPDNDTPRRRGRFQWMSSRPIRFPRALIGR